ncbi:MAG: SUMF1/EgtB/PvdO family nonheme iron enzyme [Anaerolineae bacterium]|nr:SUMF1/EgtB/PvdO family nonheme iron enzyme [Anaerolineae bacterium]
MYGGHIPGPCEWVTIPGGRTTLKPGGYLAEPTDFAVAAFTIARYPVTNRQYAAFIEAAGYANRVWWTDPGWAIKEQKGWSAPRFWESGGYMGADCPVIAVSWYEAIAFCRWLSDASGQSISLPTEQQWQRAAQGDDGREFPWGNETPHELLCNWNRDVNRTSPVTRYPDGASPYGVMDMSGNVWEWCLTGWESGTTSLDSSERRVARGGCWINDSPLTLRVTLRDGPYPVDAYNLCGFRCVRAD